MSPEVRNKSLNLPFLSFIRSQNDKASITTLSSEQQYIYIPQTKCRQPLPRLTIFLSDEYLIIEISSESSASSCDFTAIGSSK